MTSAGRLVLIGYWDGPETDHSWPSPEDLIDHSWDPEERDLVASYLSTGMMATGFMGYSHCRLCDCQNGNLELSDGTFVWPDGLSHYVSEHSVRLPERFVAHAIEMCSTLENADRDVDWWRSFRTLPA